jgi:hypothetical protein
MTNENVYQPRPKGPIKLEMMWTDNDPAVRWTAVTLKGSRGNRAVVIDAPEAATLPTPSLELLLSPDPNADSVRLALGIYELINSINDLDVALGGAGFTKTSGDQANGRVTITLASQKQPGSSERINAICDRVNRANEWVLPAVVKAVHAKQAA